MKKCFKCGKELPLDSFYKHPEMKDGHVNKCKECNKLDVNTNRAMNLERIQAYDRNRSKLPKRIKQRLEYGKRYRTENPTRSSANQKAIRAVRSGKLRKRCCEVCGSRKAEMHHADYSKPFDVQWLCPFHHHAAHRKLDYDKLVKLLRNRDRKRLKTNTELQALKTWKNRKR